MAFYFKGKVPQNVYFNDREVNKILYNDVIVWKRLPKEFKEVEYIESDGNQYIDTGVYGTQKTRIDITYEYMPSTTSSIVLGNRIGNRQNELLLSADSIDTLDALFLGYANSGVSSDKVEYSNYNIPITASKKYRVVINSEIVPNKRLTPNIDLKVRSLYTSINVNKTDYVVPNVNSDLFSTFKTLDVFGGYTSRTDFHLTAMKLYALKIYNGKILQRDFIPCYNTNTSEVGLYDLVSQQFFANLGSGKFKKGADNE